MEYFILPLILLIYFELLGQSLLSVFNKKISYIFYFPVGYAFTLMSCYILTSILTALNCSFYLILCIYLLLFLASLFFIFKKKNSLRIRFNIYHLILLLISITILMYFSFNTTLGELNGFDSTFYLNLVTGNIGLNELNTNHVVYGTYGRSISLQYTFQSFYYLASTILFVFGKLMSIFKVDFYYATGFIWCFQVLFYFVFVSLCIETLNKLFPKKYVVHIAILMILVFGYGKLYYNSVFGFYGNSIRTLFVAYAIYHLIDYFKENDKTYFYISSMYMLAACATSSTATFSMFFLFFALFFMQIDKNDSLFKEYSIMLLIPLINLLSVLSGKVISGLVVGSVIMLTLWFLNDILIKYIRKYKLKWLFLILSILMMIALSYSVTRNIFDFSAFFENGSEIYDMTLDYFDLEIGYRIIQLYKKISLVFLLIYLFFVRKEKYAQIIVVLILVFFNPFCCSFLNKVNVVYYRAYELILNPFTFIYFIYFVFNLVDNKYVYYIGSVILMVLIYKSTDFKTPLYWHDSFIPSDNYNYVYKMTNDEFDVIQELKENIQYYKIDEPKIITTNILTQSYIPNGEYIYGREKAINKNWKKSELELYKIFYPVLYWNDSAQPKNPDYDHMCEHIKDAGIDFIVQDKKVEYYDEEQNIWYPLSYKIDGCGNYAFYENDSYAIYKYIND